MWNWTKERLTKVRTFTLSHLRDFQEIYFWLPIVMFGALFFHYWVPSVDPRSGVDGLGSLSGYANLGVRLVLTCIGAWIIKRTYFGELPARHIRQLQEDIVSDVNAKGSLRVLMMDRLEWLPCLAVAYFVFSQ